MNWLNSNYRALYPFTSHWFTPEGSEGPRMHYLDEGPRDAPAVVMCHGNPTWSFYYRTLIPALSRRYRVIVPDHMGCGLSDKPQAYPYTLERHIQNLEELIAQQGLENITLLMHDWGGAIGMGYATRHPDNAGRFVVMNTSAFYLPAVPWILKLARSPMVGEVLLRGLNAFAGLAVWLGVEHRDRMTHQVRAGYLAPYNNWRNRVAVYRFVQDIPVTQDHPTRETVDEIDRRLSALRGRPMLIIWGAQDFIFTVDDFLAGWRRRFPDATVHVLEDAGHYVVEDAHERIVPLVLNFLERTDSSDQV